MYALIVRVPEAQARQLSDADELIEGDVYPKLDIDKSWHVLHHALTGEVWDGEGPAAFLLIGGTLVGEDGGYGPPRLFMPDEVAAISKAVAEISETDLRRALASEDAGELYGGWEEPVSDEEFAYLAYHLKELKAFVAESVGSALLVEIV